MQVNNSKEPPPPLMPTAQNDPVKMTLEIVGDGWTFQILRAAFYGRRRFDGFQEATGAAPNIISNRLKKLVSAGVFEKVQYSDHARRFEYRLTDKGIDLYPLIILMKQWGEEWIKESNLEATPLKHLPCGHQLKAKLICETCEAKVIAHDVSFHTKP